MRKSRSSAGRERIGFGIAAAAVLSLALIAAGCSSSGAPSASAAGSSSFRDRFMGLFNDASPQPAAAASAQGQPQSSNVDPDYDCPGMEIRSGASTLAVRAPAREQTPEDLRYQVNIGRMARDCRIQGNTMLMKVGVEGRVVLGPAGTPGEVDVPVRLALVQEGVEPKTIWTKLYRTPVTIPAGDGNVPFVIVDENVSFPVDPSTISAYVLYVGFDQEALKPKPAHRSKRKSRGSR
jgi:hypothetical protein